MANLHFQQPFSITWFFRNILDMLLRNIIVINAENSCTNCHEFCVFVCQEVLWGGGCSSGWGGGASGRYSDWTECHWLQVHSCSFISFLWVAVTFSCATAGQDADHSLYGWCSINTCWHEPHTHTHTLKYRCWEQPPYCFVGSSLHTLPQWHSHQIKCICWLMLKFSFLITVSVWKGGGWWELSRCHWLYTSTLNSHKRKSTTQNTHINMLALWTWFKPS